MPYNGTGSFSLANPPFTPNTTILSAVVNSDLSDIATQGLSNCVTKDGQQTITGQLKFPSGTSSAPGITFGSDLTTGLYFASAKKLGVAVGGTATVFFDQNNVGSGQSGAQFYYANGAIINPVGTVADFAGAVVPAGWLVCSGQNLATASYPELSNVLGTTYGTPGGGNFTVPDLRGRLTAGLDPTGLRITTAGSGVDGTTLGATGGAQNVALSSSNIPSLTVKYNQTSNVAITGASTFVVNIDSSGAVTSNFAVNTGSPNTAVNKMPPTIILNKIIFAGRP
jgi:microcystin-dependent protein